MDRLARSRDSLRGIAAAAFPLSAISLAAIAPVAASADTFTVDLGTSTYFDSSASSGIWNRASGRLQSPLQAGTNTLDFGDGSDGAFRFDASTVPSGTGITQTAGDTVTIDTDTKSTFKFSSFHLGTGFKLRVTGANPLVLRVAGAVEIDGTILSDGASGTANFTTGTTPRAGLIAGGTGGAAAGAGGNGGQTDPLIAVDGLPATGPSRGGAKGVSTTVSASETGGDGGCNGSGATPPGACAAQSVIAGNFETAFTGGAGGGGGGYCVGGSCGANTGGGGGGGGGGAIRIVSHALNLAGSISAKGGAGGVNDAGGGGDCGGGGGGGSGGSVWVQAIDVSGAGTVDLAQGLGGVSTTCGGFGYDGGNGSNGVLRLDRGPGTGSVGTPSATNSLSVPASTGSGFIVVSKAISFENGYFSFGVPTVSTSTTAPGCGSAGTTSLKFQGSDDGFTFGEEVSAANIVRLDSSKFIRFTAYFDTSAGAAPCITGLSIPYEPQDLRDLNLKGGLACGTVSSGGTGGVIGILADLALLLGGFALLRRGRPLRKVPAA